MSLIDITEKIISDAKTEAKKIASENNKAIEEGIKKREVEFTANLHELKELSEARTKKLKDKLGFRLRTIEKNAYLKAKQELINEVFSGAKEELVKLNDKEYAAWLTGELKKTTLIEGAEVRTNKEREKAVLDSLKSAGLKYSISKDYLEDNLYGVIITSEKLEIDLTIDNIVEGRREQLINKVFAILFN